MAIHDQVGQDAARDQQLIDLGIELRGLAQYALLEQAPAQYAVRSGQVQIGHRAAQRQQHALRAAGYAFGFEYGQCGQHRETVAEFIQLLAGAHFGAAGDLAQREVFLEHVFLHQLKLGADAAGGGWLWLAVEAGEVGFDCRGKARTDVGAAALDLAQAGVSQLLLGVVARLLGQLEQLLLQIIQGATQGRLEARIERVAEFFEHAAHARGDVRTLGNARYTRTLACLPAPVYGQRHRLPLMIRRAFIARAGTRSQPKAGCMRQEAGCAHHQGFQLSVSQPERPGVV